LTAAVAVLARAERPASVSKESSSWMWPDTVTGMVTERPPALTVRLPEPLWAAAVKTPFSSTVPAEGSAVQT